MALYCSKKTISLIKRNNFKHHGDFHCLNCLHSFATENKLESQSKVCENKGFCNIAMPSEDTKTLEFNQYQKSDKAPFFIIFFYLNSTKSVVCQIDADCC